MTLRALIYGATGKTGQHVVDHTLRAGFDVRAVIRRDDDRAARLRDAGAETALGDVHDLASVRRLTQDVDRIYFTYPPHLEHLVEATTHVAIAAREAGVAGVVNMSQIVARPGARSPLTHQHWLGETILDHAGVDAVYIRPTYFMENLLLFNARSIAEEGRIYLPYGRRAHAPIAADDIARAVTALLGDPSPHVGARIDLTGPDLWTIAEMAEQIGTELGRRVDSVDLPVEAWQGALAELGLPAFLTHHLAQVAFDHQDGLFEVRTDDVERLTGRAPQGLRAFVRDHAAQFEGREAVFLGV